MHKLFHRDRYPRPQTPDQVIVSEKDDEPSNPGRWRRVARGVGIFVIGGVLTPTVSACDFEVGKPNDGIVEIDKKQHERYSEGARETALHLYDEANTPGSVVDSYAGDVEKFEPHYSTLYSSEDTDLPAGGVSRDTVMTVGYGGNGAIRIDYQKKQYTERGGPDGDSYRVEEVPLDSRQWSFAIDESELDAVMKDGITREEMRDLIAKSRDLQAGSVTKFDLRDNTAKVTHVYIQPEGSGEGGQTGSSGKTVAMAYETTYPIDDMAGDGKQITSDKRVKRALKDITVA